jgi:hypothetical protein
MPSIQSPKEQQNTKLIRCTSAIFFTMMYFPAKEAVATVSSWEYFP